jgi:hypothetical protein
MNVHIIFVFFLLPFIDCHKFHKKIKNMEAQKNTKIRKLNPERPPDGWNQVQLKFYLEYTNFNSQFPETILSEEDKVKIKKSLNEATAVLENLFEIDTYEHCYITFRDEDRTDWGLAGWDSDVFSEFKYDNNQCDECNYIIAFKFDDTIHNMASAKIVKECQMTPLIGIITINPVKIKSKLSNDEYLKTLMLHELIHLLGFHKWEEKDHDHVIFSSIIREDIDTETGQKYYYLNKVYNPGVFNYAKSYFNCDEILSDGYKIKLDLYEDGNVHWPKRYFLGDIMTEFDYPEEQVLSGLTLAFLEDTDYLYLTGIGNGYYTGGLLRFGKNKGCDFFNPEIKCGEYS